MPTILAIESSCDETAAAIVRGTAETQAEVASNIVASQAALHAEYGGVFPELAAQEHVKKILPTIQLALSEARIEISELDGIAVTIGPGLIGSLLIGVNAAAQLANLTKLPLLGINHWEGHLYSAFLKSDQDSLPEFPILFLTVSGGHSSLILMRNHFEYELLGSTVDDAAGEAFDKCARLLGLGYPGGPALSKAAAAFRSSDQSQSETKLSLPRPMLDADNLNFSFSGLKTALRYAIDRGDVTLPADQGLAAAAVEDAIVDVLLAKLERAAKKHNPASVAIVGGVSANQELRRRAAERFPNVIIPQFSYSTDNAAMIGAAGLYHFLLKQDFVSPETITANASLRLA